MLAFVDFDNVPPPLQSAPDQLAKAIAAALPGGTLTPGDHLDIRFYGGWFDQSGRMTPRGQTLSAQVQASFPLTTPGRCIADAKLATSLLIDPSHDLPFTYRANRQLPFSVSCKLPSAAGCSSRTCPFDPLPHAMRHDKCPDPACRVRPKSDLLQKGEQKLVDTMIAVDLVYAALSASAPLIVVSSDDDLWPATRTALAVNTAVLHLHTDSRRRTPPEYKSAIKSSTYWEGTL